MILEVIVRKGFAIDRHLLLHLLEVIENLELNVNRLATSRLVKVFLHRCSRCHCETVLVVCLWRRKACMTSDLERLLECNLYDNVVGHSLLRMKAKGMVS